MHRPLRAGLGALALAAVALGVPMAQAGDVRDGRTGAGGRAVVHQAEGRNAHRGGAYALLHRTGRAGLEPTLGVLRNGSVVVQAVEDEAALSPRVLRTTDRGRTFQDVSANVSGAKTHPASQDPYLYAEPRTGRVFTVDYVGCGQVSSADASFEAWTAPSLVCGNLADHQTLFGGPPVTSTVTGYPDVLYYCAATLVALNKATSSACAKSLDLGVTWVDTGAPAFTPEPQYDDAGRPMGWCSGLIGHGVVGPDGTIYLPKACSSPYLLVSRDEGLTWTKRVVDSRLGVNTDSVGFPDHEASVAVDARGNLYYFWMGRDRRPYLTTSRDRGVTWSRPQMVAAPGLNETVMPAVAVSPGGRVAFAYMGTSDSPGRPFPNDSNCYLHDGMFALGCATDTFTYRGVPWSGYLSVSDNALSAHPTFTTVSVNDVRDPFIVGACGPFRCAQEYDFIDVQMGPDGTPWAVYIDACEPTLVCRDGLGELVLGRIAGLTRHG